MNGLFRTVNIFFIAEFTCQKNGKFNLQLYIFLDRTPLPPSRKRTEHTAFTYTLYNAKRNTFITYNLYKVSENYKIFITFFVKKFLMNNERGIKFSENYST